MSFGDVEAEIRLEFVDLAGLHTYTSPDSLPFFAQLADCDDYELFEQTAVKKVIEFKWPLTREFTIKKLMVPYLIFMTTYLTYMNWLYYIRFEGIYVYLNYVFIAILAFFC